MADIVLRDRSGNPVQYHSIERVKLNTVDGESVEFVDPAVIPEVVESLPIALDFSGGNQEIIAPDGVVVKSAIIQKPENLTPANIAEGVNIAGIVGSMVSGSNIVVASGTFSPADSVNSIVTVPHNLGVVPDIVILHTTTKCNTSERYTIQQYCGFSKAFAEANGNKFSYMYTIMKATSAALSAFEYATYSGCALAGTIDTTTLAGVSRVHSANTESFLVADGANGIYLVPNATYNWLAIGGLT